MRKGGWQVNNEQAQQADDPSGDGWRWVRQGEALRHGDVEHIDGDWHPTTEAGYTCPRNHSYRRRIEPQQPSDSEPETMQQLKEQVQTLTRERDRYRNQLEGAIEHSSAGSSRASSSLSYSSEEPSSEQA
jgi:hypothetical protein